MPLTISSVPEIGFEMHAKAGGLCKPSTEAAVITAVAFGVGDRDGTEGDRLGDNTGTVGDAKGPETLRPGRGDAQERE